MLRTHHSHRIRTLAFACMCAIAPAFAAQQEYRLEIEPQPLSMALRQFAEQSGLQIVYYAEAAERQRTGGVSGTVTAAEGLRRLLAGTGLYFETPDEHTVEIRQGNADTPDGASRRDDGRNDAVRDTLRQDAAISGVEGDGMAAARAARSAPVAGTRATDAATEMDAVLVTGSRMKRTGDGPQPVYTMTREDIDNSGQSTVASFLNTMPMVSTATGENSAQLGMGQTTVQLRGLPAGSTLVLLNGRRVHSVGASYGSGGFFDLNLIPASAVERIEILPDSASAIYGSDALAGVVNIILKRDFQGGEARIGYGFADALEENSASLAFGHQGDRGGWSAVLTHFGRPDRLDGTEREITADKDYRRFGGPDSRRNVCNPGNVTSVDGANLPGLNSPYAAIPAGLQGVPSIADFAGSAGQVNLCSDLARYVVIQETRRLGAVVSGHFALTPDTELFADLIYTSSVQHSANNYRSLSNALVSAANPYNPFGVDVRVTRLLDIDARFQHVNRMNTTFARYQAGVRGRVFGDWDWEVSVMRSRDGNRNEMPNGTVNSANHAAALSSRDPQTAFNPFITGIPASEAVLAGLYSPARGDFEGSATSVSAFLRGRLATLPAGDLQAVIGVDHTRETLQTQWLSVVTDADRSVTSAFAELRVPLLAAAQPGAQEVLALTAALRMDDYRDFGRQKSPQAGLEWRPTDNLLVRASYGEAFRAPGLYVLHGERSLPFDSSIRDPARGGESRIVPLTSGPNPALQPELGSARSLGVVWRSERIPDLHLGATLWNVVQTDRVSLLQPQAIINNEALFPGRVTRAPGVGGLPGPITGVDYSYMNVGEIDVTGVDASFDYRWRTGWGEWTPRLMITYTDKYRTQVVPDAPSTNQASRASILAWAPRWKGAASLGWKRNAYAASITGRYVGPYLDYQDWGANTRQLGDFWLFDVAARVEIGEVIGAKSALLSGAYASLAVSNLFDSLPEWSYFSFSALGYDPSQYDIVGRLVQLNLGVRW